MPVIHVASPLQHAYGLDLRSLLAACGNKHEVSDKKTHCPIAVLAGGAARRSVLDLPDSPRKNINRRKLLISTPDCFCFYSNGQRVEVIDGSRESGR